jgi:hypothetical protein
MECKNALLEVKPGQIRTLILLVPILLYVIYSPGIKITRRLILRNRIVRAAGIELLAPRLWSPLIDESGISAFTPCLTVFCSEIRSSMSIQIVNGFKGRDQAWIARTERMLRARGSPARELESSTRSD